MLECQRKREEQKAEFAPAVPLAVPLAAMAGVAIGLDFAIL